MTNAVQMLVCGTTEIMRDIKNNYCDYKEICISRMPSKKFLIRLLVFVVRSRDNI